MAYVPILTIYHGCLCFLQSGAWYALRVPFSDVFGEDPIRGSGGTYGGNRDLAIGTEEGESIVVKYSPATKTMVVRGAN